MKVLFSLLFLFFTFSPATSVAAGINPTSPKTSGILTLIDMEAGNFEIAVNGNPGLQMIFFVTSDTIFNRKTKQGVTPGAFLDLREGGRIFVTYTTNDDMTESIAEEVTVDISE